MIDRDSSSEKSDWQCVLDDALLEAGRAVAVTVSGWPVIVVRDGDGLHALSGICPHDHAPLDGGEVIEGEVICPRHRARFDLDSGACAAGFTLPPLARYPVRVRDGQVEIDAAAVQRNSPKAVLKQRWDLTRRGD